MHQVPTTDDEKKPITNGTLPKIEEKSDSMADLNGSVNKLDHLKPPEVVVADINTSMPEKDKEFLGGIRGMSFFGKLYQGKILG